MTLGELGEKSPVVGAVVGKVAKHIFTQKGMELMVELGGRFPTDEELEKVFDESVKEAIRVLAQTSRLAKDEIERAETV